MPGQQSFFWRLCKWINNWQSLVAYREVDCVKGTAQLLTNSFVLLPAERIVGVGFVACKKNGLSFDSLIISRLLRGSLFIQGNKLILLAWVLSSLIITEFGNFPLDAFLPVLCLVYDSVPHAKATAGRYWMLVAPFCIIQSCRSLQREVRTAVLKWAGPCHLLMTCKVTN